MLTITTAAEVPAILAQLQTIQPAAADTAPSMGIRESRNRRILIKALAEGCEYLGHDGEGCHYVSSRTEAQPHEIYEKCNPRDGRMPLLKCDCHFGRSQGWVGKGSAALPCGHIMITRLYLMPADERDLVLLLDQALAELTEFNRRHCC